MTECVSPGHRHLMVLKSTLIVRTKAGSMKQFVNERVKKSSDQLWFFMRIKTIHSKMQHWCIMTSYGHQSPELLTGIHAWWLYLLWSCIFVVSEDWTRVEFAIFCYSIWCVLPYYQVKAIQNISAPIWTVFVDVN